MTSTAVIPRSSETRVYLNCLSYQSMLIKASIHFKCSPKLRSMNWWLSNICCSRVFVLSAGTMAFITQQHFMPKDGTVSCLISVHRS